MRRALFAMVLLGAAVVVRADDEVTHEFQSTVNAAGVRRVIVAIEAGGIAVRNGAAGRITVRGEASREYDGFTDRAKNQRIVDDISVEVAVKGEDAIIRPKYGENARGWSAHNMTEYEVTIEVPQNVQLEFETKFGEIDLDGSFGDIEIDLRAGEVDIRTPKANVRELRASCRVGEVHTHLGHEIIEREGLFPGKTLWVNPNGKNRVRAHVTAGEVKVRLTD